ncbi:Wzz/FepE/Etk N-terminal domain-containing protein [Shewanella frigidimarina]|uniref:Lipopolysaccharide biosynthesis protein n=1 Tax=Shewanella frigidimarina TaxID=56812 RepID=A0A106C3F2_SHEFR|nr:Wzz/FepE/Etk N-terminal domain-containing protein [Shewanella frigidimarina]KVX03528.1 lipopolysaccharide biosynthesis protein [Shewanella frigidimarina]
MTKQNLETKYNADFSSSQPVSHSDQVDLREVFAIIWQGKWTVIVIMAIFAIGSVFYAIKQPNTYLSEVLLTPADSEESGGLAALAGQFGGLASMAGINLGKKTGMDKTQMAIAVMQSRQFTSAFIQKHNLLPDLMAIKSWDMAENKVSYDDEVYIAAENKWIRELPAPFKPEPSMQEAFVVFNQVVKVNNDKATSLVTISVEHLSPFIAQQWVNWLVEDINKVMKERDVAEAIKSTAFLERKIQQTNIADIRTVLYTLIEEQAKTIMFAEVRDEYVFKTIDPAIVPEGKAGPKRALICVLGTLLGGILAVLLVLISNFIRNKINPEPIATFEVNQPN